MGNACGEGFLGPGDPPSQGSGPCGQQGGTAAGHSSRGRYCSRVPAPSAAPRASPVFPHHPLTPETDAGWGDPGAPPGEEGTEPGRVFPGRLGPGEGGASPSPAPRRDAATLAQQGLPHTAGMDRPSPAPSQPRVASWGSLVGPGHREGNLPQAQGRRQKPGTRSPNANRHMMISPRHAIGVRRWLRAQTQEMGSWPAGWAVQGLAGGRGSHHGCDSKPGAHGMQLCPQDQVASQDTSTGGCRH